MERPQRASGGFHIPCDAAISSPQRLRERPPANLGEQNHAVLFHARERPQGTGHPSRRIEAIGDMRGHLERARDVGVAAR